MELFESIYNNAEMLRLTEGRVLNTVDEIIRAIKKDEKTGKRYIETLLNGKQYLPSWIREDVDRGNISELSTLLGKALNILGVLPKENINSAISLLIRKSDSPDTMEEILTKSKDPLIQYALISKNNWAKSDEAFIDFLNNPYNEEDWKNFEKRMSSLKAQRRAVKGRELSEKDKENLYETLWESPNWGLYVPKSFEGDSELASHMDDGSGKTKWCTAAEKVYFDNYTNNGEYPLYVIKYFENGKYTKAWQICYLPDSIEFMDREDERNFDFILENTPEELLSKIVDIRTNIAVILEYQKYIKTFDNKNNIKDEPLSSIDFSSGILLGIIEGLPKLELNTFYTKYILNLPDRVSSEWYNHKVGHLDEKTKKFPISYFTTNGKKVDYQDIDDLEGAISKFISTLEYNIESSYLLYDQLSDIEREYHLEPDFIFNYIKELEYKYPESKNKLNINYFYDDVIELLNNENIQNNFDIKDIIEIAHLCCSSHIDLSYKVGDFLKLYGYINKKISLPLNALCYCCSYNALLDDYADNIILDNELPKLYKIFDNFISLVKNNTLNVEDIIIYIPLSYRVTFLPVQSLKYLVDIAHSMLNLDLSNISKWNEIVSTLKNEENFITPLLRFDGIAEEIENDEAADSIMEAIFKKFADIAENKKFTPQEVSDIFYKSSIQLSYNSNGFPDDINFYLEKINKVIPTKG